MTATAVEIPATDRIPTEFAPYWDAIERPTVRRVRAAAHRVLGFDLVPPEETVRAAIAHFVVGFAISNRSYPATTSVADVLLGATIDDEFDFGLELIIDGLELALPRSGAQ
jgi:hypothetical protein